MSYKNWIWITAYNYTQWRVSPKWLHNKIENANEAGVTAWQVLTPSQVQPGMNAGWRCWVPLVSLEGKMQMLDDDANKALDQ